jgi:UDP-glucose 4-epimerase
LIGLIRDRLPQAEILGLDVVEPKSNLPDEFVLCDVTSDSLGEHLEQFQPDTLIHFAFVVNPMHNTRRMHTINVAGTRNVLDVAARLSLDRLLVSSSATAYGAWSDNPIPISEGHPLRPRADYQYSAEKVLVEEMLEQFAEQHPETAVSWTRPCIIYGKGVDNFLTEFITKVWWVILPDGLDAPVQFVHLDDVAEATFTILRERAKGPFNIGPPDWITLTRLGQLKRRSCLKLPLKLCRAFTFFWWTCRLPIYYFPPGLWSFISYPWVVAPTRLSQELNFEFRYSSEETIRQMLLDGGWIKNSELIVSEAVEEQDVSVLEM